MYCEKRWLIFLKCWLISGIWTNHNQRTWKSSSSTCKEGKIFKFSFQILGVLFQVKEGLSYLIFQLCWLLSFFLNDLLSGCEHFLMFESDIADMRTFQRYLFNVPEKEQTVRCTIKNTYWTKKDDDAITSPRCCCRCRKRKIGNQFQAIVTRKILRNQKWFVLLSNVQWSATPFVARIEHLSLLRYSYKMKLST